MHHYIKLKEFYIKTWIACHEQIDQKNIDQALDDDYSSRANLHKNGIKVYERFAHIKNQYFPYTLHVLM